MTKPVERNILIASNLTLISAALGVINFLILGSFTSFAYDFTAFFAIAFIALLAFLIRQGYKWVKWLLVILFLTGLPFLVPQLPIIFKQSFLAGMINILQSILQLASIILLFIKTKVDTQPTLENY